MKNEPDGIRAPHGRKRGCRYWRNLLLAGLAASLAGCLFLSYIAFPIIQANSVAHPKRAPVCCVTPADLGFAYEDVAFGTSDGLTLRGWYIPSQNRAAVIVTHGVAGNRVGHLDQAAALAGRGFGVLLLDLRAHGHSDGSTITFGGEDIRAAAAYLQTRSDVDPERIGAMGLSLGGSAVLQAAARSDAIRAVVADGPGPATYRDWPYPEDLLGWIYAPFDWVWFKVLEREGVTAPRATLDVIADIAPRPILLISGTSSSLEGQFVRQYFEAAGEPKELWEIPEAGHAQTWAARPEEYADRIIRFFDRALLGSS